MAAAQAGDRTVRYAARNFFSTVGTFIVSVLVLPAANMTPDYVSLAEEQVLPYANSAATKFLHLAWFASAVNRPLGKRRKRALWKKVVARLEPRESEDGS